MRTESIELSLLNGSELLVAFVLHTLVSNGLNEIGITLRLESTMKYS